MRSPWGKGEWEHVPFFPTPHGFSGGGVWAFLQSEPDELFNPQRHVRLYAIQSAWLRDSRLVKCIPIIHWLRLIASTCPDLKETLTQQFPSL
jgi:hypothetical protein